MEQKLDRIIQLLERIAHVEKFVERGGGTSTGTGLWSPTVTTTPSIDYNGTWTSASSTVNRGGGGGSTNK